MGKGTWPSTAEKVTEAFTTETMKRKKTYLEEDSCNIPPTTTQQQQQQQ